VLDLFSTKTMNEVNNLKDVKDRLRIDTKKGFVPPTAVLDDKVRSSKAMKKVKLTIDKKNDTATWSEGGKELERVDGDVRMTMVCRPRMSLKKHKLFQFWFNTRFLEPDKDGFCTLEIAKPKIDKICKDKKHKDFPKNFKVKVRFQVV
jgi:hypothetical protein